MSVLIFAGIGAAVFSFVGWLMAPPPAPPQELRIRVASINDTVIVGIKLGDEVTFLQLNR